MFASEATRSRVAKRVTYSAYSRFATSKPSEQNTAATSAVRQSMRRLGMSLKIMKNSSTPRANAVVSRPKRHSQSRAKLRVTLLALRASQAVSRLLSTSSAPVPSTIERSSSLAMGQGRRSSVSKTSFKAARNPPNRRGGEPKNRGGAAAGVRTRGRMGPPTAGPACAEPAAGPPPPGRGLRIGPTRPPRRSFRPRARAPGAPAWCAPPHPPRARTGIPAPPRSPRRTGTARSPCSARSLARLEVVGGRHGDGARLRVRLQRRLYEPIGDGARVGHAQLLEQERERLLQVGADGRPDAGRQIPQAPLDRTDRLLAALVVKLLLGVALLPLVFALDLHPFLELAPQLGGPLLGGEHDALEGGRQVNLDRLALGKLAEGVGRQGGGPVLHRPTQAVLGARVARQRFQRVEIELHLGDGSVGQHHAPVTRPRLDGDLADAGTGAQALERLDGAVHARLQLVHVRVLAAHLADLRAHRDGDALGLAIADEPGQLGGPLVVDALLLGKRGLGKVHERRGIDVDVVEARVQLFFDQRAQRLELGLGIGGVFLGVHLHVVALDEQRPGEAFAQRRGGHHRHVFGGALDRKSTRLNSSHLVI